MVKTNVIHTGECASVMREHLPDNSIDLTVTSPPYDNLRDYNGYVFPFEEIAQQLWRVTKPGGVVVWVVADATINGSETGTSFRQALYFMGLGFNLHDTMIYHKEPPPLSHNRYEQHFEYMFCFSKSCLSKFNPIKIKSKNTGAKRSGGMRQDGDSITRRNANGYVSKEKIKGNVWHINRSNGGTSDLVARTHPAIFPEALARDHIISWSNPGDIVLDPMCGSGTTLKMAVEQGRQYIGIDISQEYVELSQRRVLGARVPLPGIFNNTN